MLRNTGGAAVKDLPGRGGLEGAGQSAYRACTDYHRPTRFAKVVQGATSPAPAAPSSPPPRASAQRDRATAGTSAHTPTARRTRACPVPLRATPRLPRKSQRRTLASGVPYNSRADHQNTTRSSCVSTAVPPAAATSTAGWHPPIFPFSSLFACIHTAPEVSCTMSKQKSSRHC